MDVDVAFIEEVRNAHRNLAGKPERRTLLE
jgi:hypothetical protein